MSNIIECSRTKAMIETDCKIDFGGKSFESGGSYLMPNPKTGLLEGVLYYSNGQIGSWDGSIKYPAKVGRSWTSCFGDIRQSIYFEINGKKFHGINYKGKYIDAQITRVRELK